MKTNKELKTNPAVKDVSNSVWLVPTEELIPNPLNTTIYNSGVDAALVASVEQVGIIVPLVATNSGLIVDGHRRLTAAIDCGYKAVPVTILTSDPEHMLATMLDYNTHRTKTISERLREFRARLQIEAEIAAKRQKHELVENFPQAPGKARDLAAKHIGMSGRHADTGLRVLEMIEQRKADGRNDGIEVVEAALDKSIHHGLQTAKRCGWIDCTKPALKISLETATPTEVPSESDCWFEPCHWEQFADAMDTPEERERLANAFGKLTTILANELNHNDYETHRAMTHVFLVVFRNSFYSVFGQPTSEGWK